MTKKESGIELLKRYNRGDPDVIVVECKCKYCKENES